MVYQREVLADKHDKEIEMKDFSEVGVSVIANEGISFLVLPDGKRFEIPNSTKRRVNTSEFRKISDNVFIDLCRLKNFMSVNKNRDGNSVYELLKSNLQNSSLELQNIYCSTIDEEHINKRDLILEESQKLLTSL